jgi:hypothetical protein
MDNAVESFCSIVIGGRVPAELQNDCTTATARHTKATLYLAASTLYVVAGSVKMEPLLWSKGSRHKHYCRRPLPPAKSSTVSPPTAGPVVNATSIPAAPQQQEQQLPRLPLLCHQRCPPMTAPIAEGPAPVAAATPKPSYTASHAIVFGSASTCNATTANIAATDDDDEWDVALTVSCSGNGVIRVDYAVNAICDPIGLLLSSSAALPSGLSL